MSQLTQHHILGSKYTYVLKYNYGYDGHGLHGPENYRADLSRPHILFSCSFSGCLHDKCSVDYLGIFAAQNSTSIYVAY